MTYMTQMTRYLSRHAYPNSDKSCYTVQVVWYRILLWRMAWCGMVWWWLCRAAGSVSSPCSLVPTTTTTANVSLLLRKDWIQHRELFPAPEDILQKRTPVKASAWDPAAKFYKTQVAEGRQRSFYCSNSTICTEDLLDAKQRIRSITLLYFWCNPRLKRRISSNPGPANPTQGRGSHASVRLCLWIVNRPQTPAVSIFLQIVRIFHE